MKVKLPVVFSMAGFVSVDAPSVEVAVAEFDSIADQLPLPKNAQYVSDSFSLSTRDIDLIKLQQN